MSQLISKTTTDAAANASIETVAFGEMGNPVKTQRNSVKYNCPKCDKPGKLEIIVKGQKEGVYKCFSCDFGGCGPIKLVQALHNDSLTYPQVIERICSHAKIIISYEEEPTNTGTGKSNRKSPNNGTSATKTKVPKPNTTGNSKKEDKNVNSTDKATENTSPQKPVKPKVANNSTDSFLKQQLAGSGLELTDIKYRITLANNSKEDFPRYTAGTNTDQWEVNYDGPDMVLHYLNLDGSPMQITFGRRSKLQNFIRVRYQTPELHQDKDKKPMKYGQPWGTGIKLWFPNQVITAYANGTKIKELHIIEGEKKADKQTKHGIYSVGITGIHNLIKDQQLPAELEQLVRKCDIEVVVFCVDGDLFELKFHPGEPIDYRARGFFSATKKFRNYFGALRNSGIDLKLILAHPRPELQLKGIDDLVVHTPALNVEVAEKENHPLRLDYNRAFIDGAGKGEYVQTYDITLESESKIYELWHLQTRDVFVEHHKKELQTAMSQAKVTTFKFGKVEYTFNEQGEAVETSPLTINELFIKEKTIENKRTGATKTELEFTYEEHINFLANRGFYTYRPDNLSRTRFVRIENNQVRELNPIEPHVELQIYTLDFVRGMGKPDWLQLLHKGSNTYMGPTAITKLKEIELNFTQATKNRQCFYFDNGMVEITPEGVRLLPLADVSGHIWQKQIKPKTPNIIAAPMVTYNGKHEAAAFDVSNIAAQCEYFWFLVATSLIPWERIFRRLGWDPETRNIEQIYTILSNAGKNAPNGEPYLTPGEVHELSLHVVNKMTGIGYLLHRFVNLSMERMVMGNDASDGEIGNSQGRSGKSLIGQATDKVINQVYIDAKDPDLERNSHIFDEVDDETGVIFFDDLRENIDPDWFFNKITGKIVVNKKHQAIKSLSGDSRPKLYGTSNHSFRKASKSLLKRMFNMAFSNWYDGDHNPESDFGHNFFQDWDEDQWSLFYNFMFNCVRIHLQHGLVECPQDELHRRRLRSAVGEDFLLWFNTYFAPDNYIPGTTTSNINRKIERREIYDSCFSYGNLKKWMTPRHFGERIKAACDYSGLVFNPHKLHPNGNTGAPDKRDGVEYMLIADENFTGVND